MVTWGGLPDSITMSFQHLAVLAVACSTAAALSPSAFSTGAARPAAPPPRTRPPLAVSRVTAAWVAGSVLSGASGALIVLPNMEPWYGSLRKPRWGPPNSVFGPVWTMLYAMIGLSCARALFWCTPTGSSVLPLARPGQLLPLDDHRVLALLWASDGAPARAVPALAHVCHDAEFSPLAAQPANVIQILGAHRPWRSGA